MPNTRLASLVAPSMFRTAGRRFARLALLAAGVIVLLTAPARSADAQTALDQETAAVHGAPAQSSVWGFLVTTGTLVPKGAQRDAVTCANLTAAQVSYAVRPALALSATVGWARSRDLAFAGDAKLDIFTYDVGVEGRVRRLRAGHRMTFSPFAGGGAGARSYNHRALPIDARHDIAAYVGGGGEIGIGRVGVRVEVRDYVTGLGVFGGGRTGGARNDVVVMTGLRFTRR